MDRIVEVFGKRLCTNKNKIHRMDRDGQDGWRNRTGGPTPHFKGVGLPHKTHDLQDGQDCRGVWLNAHVPIKTRFTGWTG